MKFRIIESILCVIAIISFTVYVVTGVVSYGVASEIGDAVEMISELTESGTLTPAEDNENLLLSRSGFKQILSAFAEKTHTRANTLENIALVSRLCICIALLTLFVISIIRIRFNKDKTSE